MFFRWLEIVADEPGMEYTVRPVQVVEWGETPFLYMAAPMGPPMPTDSTDLLIPGDYAIFDADGESRRPFDLRGDTLSFTETEDRRHSSRSYNISTVPVGMEDTLRARRNQCFITGARTPPAELAATWIFPVNVARQMMWSPESDDWDKEGPDAPEIDIYLGEENHILLCKELVELFQGNKFGVNVDDGYRIVVFEPLGGTRLPSHLTLPSDPSLRPSDELLRGHFNRCIQHNVRGGDILDDYPVTAIAEYMDDLGVYNGAIDMEDPRWQTDLGKAILAALIRGRLEQFYGI
ncbi:hypothetical protein PLICRDRAFT_702354 [Plicaturopsis crispa FD-325 SS-3]|uniref:HNH nuclease domain-containing protein n=1 Tax=Plicaturopsis crispa FD-325 SS-3 TaxID=944288 RepID=A0A0C9T3E1_PLICR|nr:hypothetical protein PLICRDRAFT_702354 [Plicaturopsis crispa FD-325 SS-3]